MRFLILAAALLLTASTCSGNPGDPPTASPSASPTPLPTGSPTPAPTPSPLPTTSPTPVPTATPTVSPGTIDHVIIIIQENRSFNNLFAGFPGATTVLQAPNGITLTSRPLVTTWGYSHEHPAWIAAYNNGAMNGWNNQACSAGHCPANGPYAYVQQSDIAPYWTMAQTYTLSDEMFATQQGPSFPAHQYLIRGTSTSAGPNSRHWSSNPTNNQGGCQAGSNIKVKTIGVNGDETQEVFPCNAAPLAPTLMGLLDTAGLTWRYYQSGCGPGLWTAPYAVKNIYEKDMANVVCPDPAQILTDIGSGQLANVTWVTPTNECSDHPTSNTGCGPSWVSSVVNAVGQSPFWGSTAIFIVWDDWGGWYDPVAPHIYNSFELGYRVPLIVISPYALLANVDHTPHEFGSILHYVESTFGLPSLDTTDIRSDNLQNDFNYAQTPTPFVPVNAPLKPSYFKTHRFSHRPVDD